VTKPQDQHISVALVCHPSSTCARCYHSQCAAEACLASMRCDHVKLPPPRQRIDASVGGGKSVHLRSFLTLFVLGLSLTCLNSYREIAFLYRGVSLHGLLSSDSDSSHGLSQVQDWIDRLCRTPLLITKEAHILLFSTSQASRTHDRNGQMRSPCRSQVRPFCSQTEVPSGFASSEPSYLYTPPRNSASTYHKNMK
jgi:hypothetical protein